MTYGLMGLYRDKIQGGLQKEFGSIIEGKSILESVVNAGGTLQLPQVIVEQQKQLANTVSAFLQWEDGVTNAEEIKAAGEFMQYYQALQTNALACVIERAIKDKLPAVKYCENISEIEFPPEKLSLFQKVKKTAFFFGGATMAAALPYVLNADIYGLSFRSEFFMFLGSAALSLVGFVTLTVMSIDRERAPGKRDALSALHYLGISDPRTFHTEMAQAMMAPAVKRCEALLEEKVQSVRALPGASR